MFRVFEHCLFDSARLRKGEINTVFAVTCFLFCENNFRKYYNYFGCWNRIRYKSLRNRKKDGVGWDHLPFVCRALSMYKGNNIRRIYAKSRGIVPLPNTDRMQVSKHNRESTPINTGFVVSGDNLLEHFVTSNINGSLKFCSGISICFRILF